MNTFIKYLLVISTVAFGGCSKQTTESAPEQLTIQHEGATLFLSKRSISAIGLETEPLLEQKAAEVIKATGMFDVPTQYTATVTSFIGSFVKSADKHVGEKVKKGQVVAIMEGPEFIELQQQYLENKSTLVLLEAELRRQANLSADSISSRKTYEKAKADYERTRTTVASLRQRLQYARIDMGKLDSGEIVGSFPVVAPMSGFLTEVNARIGSYVSPGESIMEIVDLSHLHVELAVYESDAMKVREGQKMRVWAPSAPDSVFEAEIYLIDKAFDPSSRSVKVHGHIGEQKGQPNRFIVGLYVEGEILTGETAGLSVPSSAAVFSDQVRYVFLAKSSNEGMSFVPVAMEGNKEWGNRLLLGADVPAGFSQVVTKGAGYLLGEWLKEE